MSEDSRAPMGPPLVCRGGRQMDGERYAVLHHIRLRSLSRMSRSTNSKSESFPDKQSLKAFPRRLHMQVAASTQLLQFLPLLNQNLPHSSDVNTLAMLWWGSDRCYATMLLCNSCALTLAHRHLPPCMCYVSHLPEGCTAAWPYQLDTITTCMHDADQNLSHT